MDEHILLVDDAKFARRWQSGHYIMEDLIISRRR